MSAELKFERLTLTGNRNLPRELVLQMSSSGNLTAQAFPPRSSKWPSWTIAYANAPLIDCRLDVCRPDRYCLWVDHTAFDVTGAEAREIHAALEPLGLQSVFAP